MSSDTKIIVFRLREIIYTVLLAFFILLLIICLVLMFRQGGGSGTNTAQSDTVQSDTTQDDSAQSDTAQNDTTQSNTVQSDTTQSDTTQSDTAQSDTAQNGTTQSDARQDGTTQSNASTVTVSAGSGKYIAGIYTSSLTLGNSAVDVQVTVSSDSIRSIELVNLSEATEAAYPLVSSSFENIVSQILEKQKLDGITCSAENRYTSQLLLNAISKALKTAQSAVVD
ncbi:MAG: hypothetical protein LIO99_07500 [Clostridiales bacterium]|nr:hypothetical protein [Clostridiales bacterium]